jgi:hypothetical protein
MISQIWLSGSVSCCFQLSQYTRDNNECTTDVMLHTTQDAPSLGRCHLPC